MSDLRLRPRSVTEIVDAAFQLYKRDALEYLLVTAVAYAPWVVAQLIVMRGLNLLDPTRGLASATWILGALGIFAYALMSAVLSRYSSDIYLDHPIGLGAAIRAVLPMVPRVIGATILFGLVLMLGLVPVLLGLALSNFGLIGVGVPLSIVWGVYALARFFAVFQIIVLENSGVIAAFARSGGLSRNRKGHVPEPPASRVPSVRGGELAVDRASRPSAGCRIDRPRRAGARAPGWKARPMAIQPRLNGCINFSLRWV